VDDFSLAYHDTAKEIDRTIEVLAAALGGSRGLPARFRAGLEPENFQRGLSRFNGSFCRRKRF
jgi:hypothetical protein